MRAAMTSLSSGFGNSPSIRTGSERSGSWTDGDVERFVVVNVVETRIVVVVTSVRKVVETRKVVDVSICNVVDRDVSDEVVGDVRRIVVVVVLPGKTNSDVVVERGRELAEDRGNDVVVVVRITRRPGIVVVTVVVVPATMLVVVVDDVVLVDVVVPLDAPLSPPPPPLAVTTIVMENVDEPVAFVAVIV